MVITTLGRIGQILLTLLTMRIATTILPPAEMARIFLISSAVAFFAATLISPVGMFINRRLYAWNAKGRVCHYFNYFWFYLLIVSLIATGSMAMLEGVNLFTFHTDLIWLLFLIFGSLMISTMNLLIIPSLNLLGFRAWFVYLTLATTVMSLVMAIFIVILAKPKAEFWLVGLLLGQLLIGLAGGKIFYKHIQSPIPQEDAAIKVTNNHVKLMWKFAWPILISAVLIWAQTQSYRFLMGRSLGLVEVGLFVAGYGISAGLISAFESVFTTYLQPMFYKHISNENVIEQSKAWGEYAGAIFPSLMLVGLMIVATASELTRVMLGPEYWSSSKFVVWGVIAELARVASGVYGMVAHARMKTRLLLIPSLVGASLSIALIWWLMPMYGSNGVGAALMLSSVVAFVLTYASTRNEFAAKFPRRMLIMSMCMGGGMVLLAETLRWAMGRNGSFVTTAILLLITGVIFLFFQYVLLRPLLHGKRMHE